MVETSPLYCTVPHSGRHACFLRRGCRVLTKPSEMFWPRPLHRWEKTVVFGAVEQTVKLIFFGLRQIRVRGKYFPGNPSTVTNGYSSLLQSADLRIHVPQYVRLRLRLRLWEGLFYIQGSVPQSMTAILVRVETARSQASCMVSDTRSGMLRAPDLRRHVVSTRSRTRSCYFFI